MKRFLLILWGILALSAAEAQIKKDKKYPSLLWEIRGKGLMKPSYLIGTMHVSNKLAFNLPDSFYFAIRNSQVVALETNPETWQEDLSRYDLGGGDSYSSSAALDFEYLPSEYLNISALKFYKYYGKIQRALSSNPSAINNLLYRSYGDEASDFEEDTYLDMYIFQCGKKWGKKIAGVESFDESMRLMMEAYKDAAKDRNKKDRSYSDWDTGLSDDKLQEAYRLGDLDLLDSINRYNSTSEAFDEKFIYRRNEIQATSIDSILRSGASLFVGVGAAHLPGNRGVIELLRRKGYTVRPVKMGERASRQKDMVDKIRVPVAFHTETAEDGFFKVDVPGKLYKLSEDPALKQQQFADMANGSYYMVTRIMTNAWMWNQSPSDVLTKLDSLLYENIPGKIISRSPVTKNGYKGLNILSRTRRGDLQHYNIFTTPYEIVIFKMSGNGDYVKTGPEAEKFFGSIQLKEYQQVSNGWIKYKPPFGGFSVDLPHEPYVGNDGSWIFDADDFSAGVHFRIVRTDVPNFHFIGEDSFDLALMNESFRSSSFIDTQLKNQPGVFKGYPVLDASFKDIFGQNYYTRFLIQGSHYYSMIARSRNGFEKISQFFNSFEPVPFAYRETRTYIDSSLYYSVQTPVAPKEKLIKLDMPKYTWWGQDLSEEELTEREKLRNGVYRSRIVSNDSTGESVYVSFFHSDRYQQKKDSISFRRWLPSSLTDSSVTIDRKVFRCPPGINCWETFVTDTGSSRRLWTRSYYRNGSGYIISTLIDTVSSPSSFISSFFNSFDPADTLESNDGQDRQAEFFFNEFMSSDTVMHARALRNLSDVELREEHLGQLQNAISSLDWQQKKYLDTKVSLIDKLGLLKSQQAANLLEQYYYTAGDTIQLQYASLENLLQQKTPYAFQIFSRIMVNEPPVLETSRTGFSLYSDMLENRNEEDDGNFMDELFDSLKLTRTILPELLPLINLKDYQRPLMKLLARMIDSSLVTAADYREYFSKFFIEGKQELKKQSIAEKKKAIEKAEKDKSDTKTGYYDDHKDEGNADLSLYAALLMPFEDKNPAVANFIRDLTKTRDKKLRLNTVIQLLKHHRNVDDSLLETIAAEDQYRIELYQEMKKLGKLDHFPSKWKDHVSLGRSVLVNSKPYDRPDTLSYLDRRAINYSNKNGYVYFFKYKLKKDDLNWKIATVGVVPGDPNQFDSDLNIRFNNYLLQNDRLTSLRDTKIRDDKPLGVQLDKILHEWLVMQRNSGKEFFAGDEQEDEN